MLRHSRAGGNDGGEDFYEVAGYKDIFFKDP